MTDDRTAGWIDRHGIADAIPLFLPAIPFGFVIGLAVSEGEMPIAIGWAASLFVFAGAAQLAVAELAGTASVWAVIVAGLVINTRHVMYSAALAPTFQRQPRWMRWFGPFVLIDQVFALVTLQTHRPPEEFRRYYLTVGLFFYVNWQWATALGLLVGPVVPESWRLGFAPPIMFLGIVLASINKRPQAAAAIVGGLVGLATAGLQDRLGILIGAIAGVAVGAYVEFREESAVMSTWAAIAIVATVGLMTYSMRAVAIVALANRTIPPAAERTLRYVGPAVLAALTFNLAAGGEGGPGMESGEVLALLVAGGMAWWKKNLILTLIAGMLTLWLTSWLVSAIT